MTAPLAQGGGWREVLGWAASAATAAVPLVLAFAWVEAQAGHDRGAERAVLLDLAPLPEIAAVAEAAPAAPMSAAPEPEQVPPKTEAPPEAPVADPAPVLPVQPIAAPQPPADAPAPPQTLPEPPPEAVAEAAPIPAVRPRARPNPPAPVALDQPATQAPRAQVSVSGSSARAPVAPMAARKGQASLEASWGASIRTRIEKRKSYPKAAQGAAGRVVVTLVVARDGRLAKADVAQSSGHPALDEAALGAVRRAGRLPAAPRGLDTDQHVFRLPMDFEP